MAHTVKFHSGGTAHATEELGPFCQSCAMPLRVPADFGTTAEGPRQNDYCHFCFAHGTLTEPDITFEQMLEKTIALGAAATGQPVAAMRAAVTPLLPTLKRWRERQVPYGMRTGGPNG